MNNNSIFMSVTFLLHSIFVLISATVAQDSDTFICPEYPHENSASNKSCTNCGESLTNKQKLASGGNRFISERVDPPRLFTVPVARVLGSLDISLTGGGAFGVATDQSFLGTVGIGLGNIAEVEFSRIGLVNNITRGSTVFPTSAFKLILIPENKWYIPSLSVAFRSSSNWQDVQSDQDMLMSTGYAADAEDIDKRISNIGYDTRFTTMYTVSTLRLGPVSLHAGLSLTDVRVKDLSVDFYFTGVHSDSLEKQKNIIGGFFGFDIESNPQTKLMFEARTMSNYEYNSKTRQIDVSEALVAIGGIRFFFNSWLSTDVGVWYQNTFKGIADMQIKMGLNVYIPVETLGRKIHLFSSDDP